MEQSQNFQRQLSQYRYLQEQRERLKKTKEKAMSEPVTEMKTTGREGTTIDHPAFSGGQ